MSSRLLLAAALAVAATGCGSHTRNAATTSSQASTAEVTTAAATTTATGTASGDTATQGVTGVVTTGMSPKHAYEARMQARIDLVVAQCYSPDPGVAARQALARVRAALRQLEAIRPPRDAAHAHRELIAATRVEAAVAAKRVRPAKRLAALIEHARADGRITPAEQTAIQQRQQALLVRYLVPRSIGKREGDALRELRRKGYDVAPKGPPKAEYVRRVQTLVDAAGNPAKSFRTTTSASDLRKQLVRQRDVAWRAARTLDGITPPRRAIYAQQQLVGALCDRGRLYDDMARALAVRGTPQLVRFSLINARDADRIGSDLYRSAIEQYRRAGYRVRAATGPSR